MKDLKATQVFTPSDFPDHTYVARNDSILEKRLRDALETPGEIVSLSGPSKSGKTVLIERVVGQNNLLCVTGASLESPDDLWARVLDLLEQPDEISITGVTTTSIDGTAGGEGEFGIPLFAKAKASGSISLGRESQSGSQRNFGRRGLTQVIAEIANTELVLLIDDFHYMPRHVQTLIAREIKEAARQGVKICTASVPHRSDDVVRGNPELRGRIRAIDSTYWSQDDLLEIPKLGFQLLNSKLDENSLRTFAVESSGSPQLMQCLCLETCFALNIRDTQIDFRDLHVEEDLRREIMEEVATRTDFSSLVRTCHSGPRSRGRNRSTFTFSDGSAGDVYRSVLLSLASDPPSLGFPASSISTRISNICKSEIPTAGSVYQACSQLAAIALTQCPEQRIIEWDDDNKILDIVDPYFLFYIRWSNQLASLAKE